MTFSALSYHPQLPYKLLILISTHNTRSSFRSENTSEGIWSILFPPRFLEGRKETKHSVSLFFGFVVTYRERDLFIDLLACVQKTLFFQLELQGTWNWSERKLMALNTLQYTQLLRCQRFIPHIAAFAALQNDFFSKKE